jgi:magnesium transporter
MIVVYRSEANGLKTTGEFGPGTWIHLTNPTRDELDTVVQKLGIPSDFLTDPLDLDERARMEREGSWTLLIVRTPHYDESTTDIPFITIPIGIIFDDSVILTICAIDPEVLRDFVQGRVRNFSPAERTRFILQIFLRIALLFLRHLKEINKRTSSVERELHKALKNEELIRLLDLEKSLVYITTSLKSNELMMEKFYRMGCVTLGPEDKDLLDDLIVENKQAIEMANVYSSILSGMMDAFASVISNNVNAVIKILTGVTIILMIPTLVASIYGMNVDLPFQHTPWAFPITIGISVLLSAISVMIFIRRRWL